MLESYQSYATYEDAMELLEDLIPALAKRLRLKDEVVWQGKTANLKAPFLRLAFHEALRQATGLTYEELHDRGFMFSWVKERVRGDLPHDVSLTG
jgi:lysyl-tRNA synthetase class 2